MLIVFTVFFFFTVNLHTVSGQCENISEASTGDDFKDYSIRSCKVRLAVNHLDRVVKELDLRCAGKEGNSRKCIEYRTLYDRVRNSVDFLCQTKKKEALAYKCPSRWLLYERSCFNVQTKKMSWKAAKLEAYKNGAKLASINSPREFSFIKNFVDDFGSAMWIGLNRVEFGWSDSSVFDYQNWNNRKECATCPPNNDIRGALIVTAQAGEQRQTWAELKANTVLQSAICKKSSASENCDAGWQYFAPTKSCYFYSTCTPGTWTEAEYKCRVMGSQLASVHSEAENKFLFKLAKLKPSGCRMANKAWIGLSTAHGNLLKWNDDGPVKFVEWAIKPKETIFCSVMAPGREGFLPELCSQKLGSLIVQPAKFTRYQA